jgi:hypothetical protein
MSEIDEIFGEQGKGIGTVTISRLKALGITDLSSLKSMGWKKLAEVSQIAEKKLVPLFSEIGETITEDEIIEYRNELKKRKVSPDSSSTSSSSPISSATSISPPESLTQSQLSSLTPSVSPDLNTISAIGALEGGGKTPVQPNKLLAGRQIFIHFKITTDLEDFILRLVNNPQLFLGKLNTPSLIEETILNSSDSLVPSGARAHVRQWLNLLETKVTGRRAGYSPQTMTTPAIFRTQLTPLIELAIEGVVEEISNGSLLIAKTEIENSRLSRREPIIKTDTIINTIILYKIYIDAKGSSWDGQTTTGQLGVTEDDSKEFFRRMKSPQSGGSVDFNDLTIKRAWSSYQSGQAVLLAGMPGSGKTYFSKAVGNVMTDGVWNSLPFTRINVTGGLEPVDLIGDWNYQAQILALTASKLRIGNRTNLTKEEIDQLRENIYTIDYFNFGPLALCMIQGVPILIDEVNRGSPDIQNTLLQAIDENELVIPSIGRIKAAPGFFVMCTINEQDVGTTELGAAFLRRVNYLSFDEVTDYKKWVIQEYPDFNIQTLKQMDAIRLIIKEKASISSEIPPSSFSAWARELINIYGPNLVLDKQKIIDSLGTLLKNKTDIEEVRKLIDPPSGSSILKGII